MKWVVCVYAYMKFLVGVQDSMRVFKYGLYYLLNEFWINFFINI